MEQLAQEFDQKLNPPFEVPPQTTNLDVWKYLDLYFRDRGLVFHKLEPYNLLLEDIKHLIRTTPPIVAEDKKSQGVYQYKFGNVTIFPPTVTPQQARLRDMNYNLSVHVDVVQNFVNALGVTESKCFPNQKVMELPCLLKSELCLLYGKTPEELIEMGECPYDLGGYYIVNGKERVIVTQERIEYNRVFVWPPHKEPERKKYRMTAEVRSVVTRGSKPGVIKLYIEKNFNLVALLSGIKEPVLVGTILHIYGALCDPTNLWTMDQDSTEKMRLIFGFDANDTEAQEIVKVILDNSAASRDSKAPEQIFRLSTVTIAKDKETEFVNQLFRDELLVNLPQQSKPYFLGYMVKRMIEVFLKRRSEDDRDHFANKRCDTDGKLLEDLVRGFYQKYLENIKDKLDSHPNNVNIFERETCITKEIHQCMGSGNWAVQKIGFTKVGVCQLMTRLNWISALSHMKRDTSNRNIESRCFRLRSLHSSQWGVFDPSETPEGKNTGLVKNMTMVSHITSGSDPRVIREYLRNLEPSVFHPGIELSRCTMTKVFLNGVWIGTTDRPGVLLGKLRHSRKISRLHHDTSIAYKSGEREVWIMCDSGRCSRPLLVVEQGKLLLTEKVTPESWHTLIDQGYIQYVDTLEEQTSVVSTFLDRINPRSQYCEIHPALILGVCSSIIPWPSSNQSPRNTYSGAMTKQAISIFALNFLQRFDTSSYMLNYAQRALVAPRMSEYLAYNQLATGMNCVVAIMCYSGYNQEDSIIMNRAAVERGLFVITVYKTYSASERNIDNQTIETIEAPFSPEILDKTKNYNYLDEFGIIKEGSPVRDGIVLIHKSTRREGKGSTREDSSVIHKLEEVGVVDKVHITKTADGNKLVKVRVAFTRSPIEGDKFASTEGQKGTLGLLMNPEDMPFTADGITPDIIINPHAFPSRMTIGQLVECVTGKAAALTGKFQDATPFTDSDCFIVKHLEQVGNALNRHGFQGRGEEVMYSGMTGEMLGRRSDGQIKASVFIGPTYYRRLKHMILDKLSAREEGPNQSYTRQPANHGRKHGTKFTSIKFGNMEVDAMESQGASASVWERMYYSSDKYQTDVCDKCGCIGGCKCKASVTRANMPYVFKLLYHNVAALQLEMTLRTENSIEDRREAE